MIVKFISLIHMINIEIHIVDSVKILDIYFFIKKKTGVRGGLIRIFIYLFIFILTYLIDMHSMYIKKILIVTRHNSNLFFHFTFFYFI